MFKKYFRGLTTIALMFAASLAMAGQYQLVGEQSSLYFTSIKNSDIAETHHFTDVAGSIDKDGKANVVVQLASVETHIAIRNERMQSMLFNVLEMPKAVVSAHLSTSLMKQLTSGAVIDQTLPVTIELHGKQTTQESDLRIVVLTDGSVQVTTRNPLFIDAADFALTEGIEKLREIAGLKSITAIVPVTATFLFKPTK